MKSGWEFSGTPVGAGDAVTLVEGSSFCVSDSAGAISRGSAQGVFYMDTRIVAGWSVSLDGQEVEPLAVFIRDPHHATFLGRARPRSQRRASTLLVQRERYLGAGMREDFIVQNVAGEPARITLELSVDGDFADLFAVKQGRTRPYGDTESHAGKDVLEIDSTESGFRRGVRIKAAGAVARPGALAFALIVPAHGEWRTTVEVLPTVDGVEIPPTFPLHKPIEEAAPTVRLREWSEHAPVVLGADQELMRTVRRSEEDLGSLRIFDPEHPERAAVAAGAPWFMALFGRDSLLTAYMALPVSQQLALGTLQTLARFQGADENPMTEEQPGRILHEMRFGAEASRALGGASVYYGTADATPLFVMVLGELSRWGLAPDDVHALIAHADRALEWVDTFGDRDGDGFVEYQRLTDRGLRNQGWKDSWDGINYADGRIAEPPIALCEVQGYVYAAYKARAAIARRFGNDDVAESFSKRAARLKAAFNEHFWLPDKGWFAVGLDRDKQPIDALTSNIGHCLWTGIIDADKARPVADHLLSSQMFSGWGVRTLGTEMGAYNPISYHNGSVWPHDSALIAAGLMQYGFVEHAQRVAEAVLAAAGCFDGRLPELFSGLDRGRFPRPVDYPTSCVPQAWASASPLQLMRTLLRFDPDLPEGKLYLDPALPESMPELHMKNLPLGATRLNLSATASGFDLHGLPPGVELIRSAAPSPV